MFDEISDAIKSHRWYAVAAIGMLLTIQFVRKHPKLKDSIWDRIPTGAKFLVPMLSAGAMGFIDAYQRGDDLGHALGSVVSAMLMVGLTTSGAAAWLRESPLPWDGGRGGQEKKAGRGSEITAGVGAILLLAFSTGSSACAEAKPIVRDANDVAAFMCRTFYAERRGISVEEAAQFFCKDLEPWVDALLRARALAGARLETKTDAGLYLDDSVDGGEAGQQWDK